MLRTTRLPSGRPALLPRPILPTSTPTTTITARPVTFATGKANINRPLIFTGTRGGTAKPNPSSRQRFFARPPSTWGPSTISTLALGSMLVGSWCIWKEGRNYWVAAEADRHEPRVLGTHREGKVNQDYINYEKWVEAHARGKK